MLTFTSKYKGGISKNRIINAFDFLKQRSEEASLAARREASMIRKQQEKQQQQQARDEDEEEGQQEKSEQELFALKKTPWEKNAESTLPKGGAGLVSLMGDMSNLEGRIQGGWTLAIKASGRYVSCQRLVGRLGVLSGERAKKAGGAGQLFRRPGESFEECGDGFSRSTGHTLFS